MDYVDFDSLAQKLAPTLQVLENKRKELLKERTFRGFDLCCYFSGSRSDCFANT